MKKAVNGIIVTTWDDKSGTEKIYIAKTKKEAQEFVSKIMGL